MIFFSILSLALLPPTDIRTTDRSSEYDLFTRDGSSTDGSSKYFVNLLQEKFGLFYDGFQSGVYEFFVNLRESATELFQKDIADKERNDRFKFSQIKDYSKLDCTPRQQVSPEIIGSGCPFLNAGRNCGFFARDGKNIPVQAIKEFTMHVGNVNEQIATILTDFAAKLGNGKMVDGEPVLNLSDLNTHSDSKVSAIEHDVSLSRKNLFEEGHDNYSVDESLVKQLLKFQNKDGFLTLEDVIAARSKRFEQTRAIRPSDADELTAQNFFVMNGETIFVARIMGGEHYKVSADIVETFFNEEIIPPTWKTPTKTLGLLEFLMRIAYVSVSK